jgi:hypothetical protein
VFRKTKPSATYVVAEGLILIAPDGFSLNQILQDIENIYKFKDLVPIEACLI